KDKYGICKLTPDNMLRNAYPTIETAVDKTKYFLKKLELDRYCVFSKWDFTNFKHVNSNFKNEVVCTIHGIFKCRPNHLLFVRAGCKKCANSKVGDNATGWTLTNWINSSKTSKHCDSCKVYIIKCWDENEDVYKIGRTFRKLKERFGANSSVKMPYNWEVVKIIEKFKDAEYIYKLESKLKQSNKVEKYRPIKQFRGMEECFKNVEYGM